MHVELELAATDKEKVPATQGVQNEEELAPQTSEYVPCSKNMTKS